jgi:1-acyl-sn-glycerol-3-phosphate acyltransferase
LPSYEPAIPPFYWLMTDSMRLALGIFARWRVIGRRHVPRNGPLIVAANHLNVIDPPLVAASLTRRLHFMAKQELFEPRSGIFIALYGAFPVRRFEADLQALRTARRILDRGEVVAMFPEGHRSDGAMIAAHPGTALIALQSGAPVLPVAITGSERVQLPASLLKHPPIAVTIGRPFVVRREGRIDSRAVEQANIRIMRTIADLLPARYRGVYTETEAG